MNLALFASGNGTNVQAIIDAVKAGEIAGNINCLVCDNPKAYVVKRAKDVGIDTLILSPKDCQSRQAWELEIIKYLEAHQVDLIILAGFMRIIGADILNHYPKKIINIHPSLLPAFPGRKGIQDAYNAGVKESGVTVHYVDAGIDTGEIIAQERLQIQPEWTLEKLENKIHQIEHSLYPKVIQQLAKEFNEKGINVK
ncbi:MAG: phosphoribosylglycinamide formyltransferase [Ruoffia tabacinasalis]|uniref:phosphoribosylglycinamide formyltransferase n=1 Tax=Ruoffia TaxID=2862144 RepID=UPI000EC9A9E3|nr:phosphoribosylglycinamide formyltransferase [Aerococcaceae bacterium]